MTKKPTSLIGMMENIQFVVGNNLPLSEKFYDDDNLKNLFGADEVQWEIKDDENNKLIFLSKFDENMISPVFVGENKFSGIKFILRHNTQHGGSVIARIQLILMGTRKSLVFENIEHIFGKEWKRFPYWPVPSSMILKRPTHLHGNARIKYDYQDLNLSRFICLEFGADGTLMRADFDLEKRQLVHFLRNSRPSLFIRSFYRRLKNHRR